MQVKFISSIYFNMPAIYPHHIETHYIRCHITIHYDRTIYLCLPPFFLWMLPYNHLSISIFKFHLRFYLKNSATTRGVSPSFLYIHSLLPLLPDFVQCFPVRFCKKGQIIRSSTGKYWFPVVKLFVVAFDEANSESA